MTTDGLVTLKEAASLLGVTVATLRNWDKSGKLEAVRHPLNNYRSYRVADVMKLQQPSLLPVDSSPPENPKLTAPALRRLVRSMHRILRDGEGNSSLIERFDELTKVLFCKLHAERSGSTGFTCREGETAKDTCERVRLEFAERVAECSELFPDRFRHLNLRDSTLKQLVDVLSPVSLGDSGEDLKGLAYEEVIRNTFEKGDNQQFFTPRTIIDFMVGMVSPLLNKTVCDPACGTGGFLLAASQASLQSKMVKGRLIGFEIDHRLAWVAGINLDMHGAANFEVRHCEGSGSLSPDMSEWFGSVDVILTNPPFGSDLTDPHALETMVLGRGRSSRRRGVLFIERCLDLLVPGGVVAIVIDDGVLNAPGNQDTRRLILERADPIAIISLPETAFMPYASVKTSILFVRKKGGKTKLGHAGKTFFAKAEVVGRKPNGDPLLRSDPTTGKMELDNDLPKILGVWASNSERDDGEFAFWSEVPSIRDKTFLRDGLRLDLAYHHPARLEAEHALRASPFPLRRVADVCEVRNDAVIPSQEFQDEDITYLGLANIEAHTGMCSPVLVPGASLKSTVKRYLANDILFAKMRPELRKVCLVPSDYDEGFASAECLVLVPRKDSKGLPLIIPELLALLLRSDLMYGQIVHLVMGIGRPRLNKVAILNALLPVPTQADQQRLLQLYKRSEAASLALIAEGKQAIQKADDLMANARRQLVEDLLQSNRSPSAKDS